jgi:arylformamidase
VWEGEVKEPLVYLNYTQAELDAAYNQAAYQPNIQQLRDRWISNSERTRQRIGAPSRVPYGPTEIEQLDIFRTDRAASRNGAPVFIFIHGGAWRAGAAKTYEAPAEMFIRAGAHYVAPDFVLVQDAGGSLFRWPIRCGGRSRGFTRTPRVLAATATGSISAAIPRARTSPRWR